MSSRSPARWMAPLALLVAIAAVGYVVSSATREDEQSGPSSRSRDAGSGTTSTTRTTSTKDGARTTPTGSQARSYTVRSGDTLGVIAEQTGMSVAELQELNPELDPQSLTVGDRIRLRR